MLNLIRAFIVVAIAVLVVPKGDVKAWTHGVATISISCSDSTPSIAAAFGFSTCTFYDSMQSASTVDVSQSGLAGFNWYTQQSFCTIWFTGSIATTVLTVTAVQFQNGCGAGPSATLQVGMTIGSGGGSGNPTPWTKIASLGTGTGLTGTYNLDTSQTLASNPLSASFAQASNTMVFSGAGLSMNNVSQGTNNFGISTVHILTLPPSATPNTYHGTTFQNGMYKRTYLAYDEASAPQCTTLTGCRWPADWAFTYAGTVAGTESLEIDFWDAIPGSGSAGSTQISNFLHNFGPNADSNYSPPTRSELCSPTINASTFHTMDFLWVPTTKNGGAGIYANFFDIDTCAGNAVVTGSISGFTLTVTATLGTGAGGGLKAGSYITGKNVLAKTTIVSDDGGGHYTVSDSQTAASATIVGSNMPNCTYFLSPSQAGCTSTGSVPGVFAAPETNGNGLLLILSSGCTVVPYTSAACNAGTPAGNWPMKVKNIQSWQTTLTDKVVH